MSPSSVEAASPIPSSMRRVLCMACALVLSAGTADCAVKPVLTNKHRFRIPFRFDQEALQRMNARELQLYTSPNRGGSWELAQSIRPQTGKFEFQAPADGEYWFAVRTVDGSGQPHPPGSKLEAGLIVVVDSLSPSLAVNLEQTSPGKIQLTWSASDANLDPTTLRLEYIQPGQSAWQTVSVVPTQRGMTAWTVTAAGRVAVRGSISDLAGNRGQTEAELVASAAPASPDRNVPDLRQPIAKERPNDQYSEQPTVPEIMIQPRTADARPQLPPSVAPGHPPTAPIARPNSPLVSDQPARRPDVMQERWAPTPAAEPTPYRGNSRQRIVNTRRFQLGYKVDDVGPSGVGGVDLYITPDRGRQWYRYGEDADRTSPFDVEVPRDGEYGFTVRVRSGAGLALEPPMPGEPPSITIIVDQTPPQLELMPIRQGAGADLNQLTIGWRITEDLPSDKPVSLYYAATPDGPWEPISGWRADTGTFAWSVGPGSPSQFYVRVVARDAAGNVSQSETAQPVVVDLARPSARIVDVENLPSSGPR